MKTILLLPLALALPAFAGSSAKDAIAPAQSPAPCLFNWFAGGSVGYLTELEAPMYNLQIGTDTCWNLAGWNVALYGEVGYTEKDKSYAPTAQFTDSFTTAIASPTITNGGKYSISEVERILASQAGFTGSKYDLDIVPVTFNVKLERPVTGNLNAYFGGGLGMADVDFSANIGLNSFSDNKWVFASQMFAGLNYNFNPHFEVYSGARWIYFQDAKLSDTVGSGTLKLGSDCLLELGARYNF